MNKDQQHALLNATMDSIRYGLSHQQALIPKLHGLDPALLAPQASFVTLKKKGQLRGCIGNLVTDQTVIGNVCQNAFSAAYKDPRFPPLTADELKDIDIHISLLGESQAMQFTDENNLLEQLRPKIDGLILRVDHHHATFLPSVWDQLPEPTVFLQQLKKKAGLDPDYWSDHVQCERYQVESFGQKQNESP